MRNNLLYLLERLFEREDGQDILEYALLSAFIGLAGVGLFDLITGGVQVVYTSWVDAVQNNWVPPDPASGS